MSRLRGRSAPQPTGDAAHYILNGELFGDQACGGYDRVPLPERVPLDWPSLFGRQAPLTLEIGFNRGRFIRGLAEAFPERDHVGVEVRRKFCWRLATEMTDAGGPANVRLVWADAKRVVTSAFAPDSLTAVYINFPDPWWKRRHVKRRLVDQDFARLLAGRIAPGGAVWVKSDVPAIAEEIREALCAVPSLGPPVPFGEVDLPHTARERRCLIDGLPVTRFFLERLPG